jgi:hypothetical protein
MSQQTDSIITDADYVILNNPLRIPKFLKTVKQKDESISFKDTYTPKIFYEIVSRLNFESIKNLKDSENVIIEIETKKFAESIGALKNNSYYTDIRSAAEKLTDIKISFKDDNGYDTKVRVITKTKAKSLDEKGKIILYIDVELAKEILKVKETGNFSFLKSNLFSLQNSQAIKLYPFFKSWLNKGIFKKDLDGFKKMFGYDTSGYDRYSNFENKVLIPATNEINEKTDIYITYQTEGENLDGKRPRITGLIFYIKLKDKIKQLAEPQQPIGQIQDPQSEKQAIRKSIQNNEPSEAEIIVLGEKLKLSLIQIQTIIGELKGNHIRAFEVLQGCINEGKTKTINSNFAYIITSLSTLGIGLWQEQKEKKQKEELQKIEKQKELKLKILNDEYQKRKEVQFVKIYNDCTEPQKIELLEYIKDMYSGKSHLKMYVENNILTNLGIYMAGQIAAEKLNVGLKVRQNKFREEIYNREKITIDFDLSDKVILSNTLFEPEKTQEAPTATDRQQVATPAPTEPKPTNTLTDAQKAENIKKYNEMKAKTVEAVKMPVDDTPPVLEQVKAVELEVKAKPAPAEPQAEVEPVEQSKQEPEPKSILSNLINKFTNW